VAALRKRLSITCTIRRDGRYAWHPPVESEIHSTASQDSVELRMAGGASRGDDSRRHLVDGDPVNVIAKVSRKIGSAIVVLGAVSRSGLKRAFIGDTAERLIDQLRSDMLVVKPPYFPIRIPRAQRGIRVVAAPGPMP
jgi:nucleotide-binding universal stress UspA family protein